MQFLSHDPDIANTRRTNDDPTTSTQYMADDSPVQRGCPSDQLDSNGSRGSTSAGVSDTLFKILGRLRNGNNSKRPGSDQYIPLTRQPRAIELDSENTDYVDGFGSPIDETFEEWPDSEPEPQEEAQTLTIRAVLIGSMLGLVVGASNIYLGLKTGFSFGASLFGAIFGFAILKPLSTVLPVYLGGGYFGPKENCTIQSAATAAGGLTTLFVAAVPAMYHLGLMTTPKQDMNRLFLLTTITAFYGLFFAVPLRKYYILQQRLVFPTPTATAYTIQSLHATATPSERRTAEKKIKVIGTSFVFSLGFKTVASYFPGVLWDWHIFWWLSRMGLKSAIAIDSWGWWLEFTPAFISAGALSGLNASWSFLAGAILAWGMIGPLTVNQGVTFGEEIDAGKFPGWMNYMSMTSSDPIHRPSPRYWMLWPGVTVMLVYSFTEVAWSAPMLFPSIKTRISALLGRPLYVHATSPHDREDEAEEDPASPEDQIPTWQWTFGLLLSSLGTLVVGKYAFDMDYLVGVVALLLAFVFSFVGVQASGTTDVNPVGTIAKASQLVIGGITKRQGLELYKAQTTNLIAGSIAGQAASHAVDMVGDLKTGHILGASPRSQFYAQLAGSFLGIWLSVVLFVLFASAYPCITDLGIPCTAFGMPAVQAWRSVTEAVTRPELPIPPSSAKTAVVLGIISGITVPVRQLLVPQRHRGWVPNWSAFGLGFVVPQTYYPIAMVIGAHIAHYWEGRYPAGWEIWGYSLSAGLIAGEGIGGVVTALMVILGLDGGVYGSAIGCPGLQYCG